MGIHRTYAALAALAATLTLGCVFAALAAPAASPPMTNADIPMADYLALLEQISPAAHQGARTYLQAHQRRCGYALPVASLRRAISEGSGDPVLMAMIRASHLRDATALDRLSSQVACDRGARP